MLHFFYKINQELFSFMDQKSELLVGGDIKDKQIIFKDGLIENSEVLKAEHI